MTVTEDFPVPVYEVLVCERDGTDIDTLGTTFGADATVIPVQADYGLNGAYGYTTKVQAGTAGLTALKRSDGRPAVGGVPEIHWVRDGVKIFQGFPQVWTYEPRSGWFTIEGFDPMGYLPLLVFGDAERANFLAGADMEDNSVADNWSAVNCTITGSTTQSVRGTKSMRIVATTALRPYAYQAVNVPDSSERSIWYGAAWLYVPAGSAWPYGLQVIRYYDGVQSAPPYDCDLPSDLENDKWVRLDVGPIGVDPEVDVGVRVLAVRLYGTQDSTVYWDATQLVRNDNTGAPAGTDYSDLVAEGIRYASDKANLHLGRVATPTGEELPAGYRYEHTEHAATDRVLTDHVPFVDVRFNHQTRDVEIGPALGLLHATLDLGTAPNVIRKVTCDGSQVVTSGISLGTADGVTREEAGYVDPDTQTALDAGDDAYLSESVERAPKNTALKDLDKRPVRLVTQVGYPGEVLEVAMGTPDVVDARCPGDWVTIIHPGDTAVASVLAEPFEFTSMQRLTRVMFRPQAGETFETEWSPVPPEVP